MADCTVYNIHKYSLNICRSCSMALDNLNINYQKKTKFSAITCTVDIFVDQNCMILFWLDYCVMLIQRYLHYMRYIKSIVRFIITSFKCLNKLLIWIKMPIVSLPSNRACPWNHFLSIYVYKLKHMYLKITSSMISRCF